MRYIPLILFLTFSISCQTFNKQARKGWFGMQQAKASDSKTATTRTSASYGKFICDHYGIWGKNKTTIAEEISQWANESCNPNKSFSISGSIISNNIVMCCINKK